MISVRQLSLSTGSISERVMEDSMFESALLETSAQRKHQEYATVASFTIQIAVAGVLVLVPLLYTQALPAIKLIARFKSPHASLAIAA
jgi:hypothetical protein